MILRIRNFTEHHPDKRRLQYVKLMRDESPEFAMLPFAARCFAAKLLAVVDPRTGQIDCGRRHPESYIFHLVRGHRGERRWIRRQLDRLIQDGYLETIAMPGDPSPLAEDPRPETQVEAEIAAAEAAGSDPRQLPYPGVTVSHGAQSRPDEEPSVDLSAGNRGTSFSTSNKRREEKKEKKSAADFSPTSQPPLLTLVPPTEPEPAKRGRPKKASPLARWQVQCGQLWELQERLRAEVIPGCRSLKATDERLERIAERLEAGATVEDCEHVLRVYAHEARISGQTKWFNGETNWRRDNFDRAAGQPEPKGSVASGGASLWDLPSDHPDEGTP